MAVRRSERVLHRPSISVAVAAAIAGAVVILFMAMYAASSLSGTAAARHAPMLAVVRPASGATSESRVEARGHTAASLAMAPTGDEASAEDRDLRAWVEWKYRYLLEDAELDPASRTQLVELLMARERLVRDPDAADLQDRLADIDHQLDALLGAADREHYRSLRESDAEQSRLGDYGGGIDQLAPLDDDQMKRLLTAKLRYKAIFERELGDAHLEQPALSVDARERAFTIVNAALDHYRDAFLREAAGILDDQQIVLLTSYETTETERERQRLQIAINAK